MNKVQLAPGIWVYKNSATECEQLIEDIERELGSFFGDGHVFAAGDSDTRVDMEYRKVQTFGIGEKNIASLTEGQQAVVEKMKSIIMPCVEDYRAEYAITDLIGDSWMVLKYSQNDHFTDHADDGPRFNRTVSITAYLNDNYEGGEIEFRHFGLSYKPEQGDVLVFPSNYVYVHKVVPVKKGIRYALVNWFRHPTIPKDMANLENWIAFHQENKSYPLND